MNKNYYDVLEVKKDSPLSDIKKSYKRLAKKYHPDKNNGDKELEEKFKEISSAYEVLSDEHKRKEYDMFGSTGGRQQQGHGFNMEDIFSQFGDIFGNRRGGSQRQRRGEDCQVRVQVSLSDIMFGCTKKVQYNKQNKCQPCDGKGGTDIKDCLSCNGSGQRVVTQQTPFGKFQQSVPCNNCEGSGKNITNKCSSCKGSGTTLKSETIDINIPSGVADGMTLTSQGQGNNTRDGIPGDLILIISEIKHEKFERHGSDIYCEEWISISDAVLGTNIEVETPSDKINFKIDPGTESGEIFTSKGKGIPNLSTNGRTYGKGDLHIKVNVKIPKNINKDQKEIFEKLKNFVN